MSWRTPAKRVAVSSAVSASTEEVMTFAFTSSRACRGSLAKARAARKPLSRSCTSLSRCFTAFFALARSVLSSRAESNAVSYALLNASKSSFRRSALGARSLESNFRLLAVRLRLLEEWRRSRPSSSIARRSLFALATCASITRWRSFCLCCTDFSKLRAISRPARAEEAWSGILERMGMMLEAKGARPPKGPRRTGAAPTNFARSIGFITAFRNMATRESCIAQDVQQEERTEVWLASNCSLRRTLVTRTAYAQLWDAGLAKAPGGLPLLARDGRAIVASPTDALRIPPIILPSGMPECKVLAWVSEDDFCALGVKVGVCDPILHKKVAIPYAWLLRLWAQGRGQDPAGRPLLAPDGRLMLPNAKKGTPAFGLGPLGKLLAPLTVFGATAGEARAADDGHLRASERFGAEEANYKRPSHWGVLNDRGSKLGTAIAKLPDLDNSAAPWMRTIHDATPPSVPRAGGDTARNMVKRTLNSPITKTIQHGIQTAAAGGAALITHESPTAKSAGLVSFGLALLFSGSQLIDNMMAGVQGTLTNVDCYKRLADQVHHGGSAGFTTLVPLGCKANSKLFADGADKQYLRKVKDLDLPEADITAFAQKAQDMQVALERVPFEKPQNIALVDAMIGLEEGGSSAWEKFHAALKAIEDRGGNLQAEIADAAQDAQAKLLAEQLAYFLGELHHELSLRLSAWKTGKSIAKGAHDAWKYHPYLSTGVIAAVGVMSYIAYILYRRGHKEAGRSRNLLQLDAQKAQTDAQKTVEVVETAAAAIMQRREEFLRRKTATSTVVDEYQEVCLKDLQMSKLIDNLTKLFVQSQGAGLYSNLGEMVRDQAHDNWKAAFNRALTGDKFEALFKEQASELRRKVESVTGSGHRTFASFWDAVGLGGLPTASEVQEAAVYCTGLQDQIHRDSIMLDRMRQYTEGVVQEATNDEYSMDAEGAAKTEEVLKSATPATLMMMSDAELKKLHADAKRLLESVLYGYGTLGIQNLILGVEYDRQRQDIRQQLERLGTGRNSANLRNAVDLVMRAADLINNVSIQLEDYEYDAQAGPLVRSTGLPIGVRVPRAAAKAPPG